MNIKKKHHYVSQFYLRAWYAADDKLIVWDGKKIFPAITESIAYKKRLYKISPLKEKQIKFFEEHAKAFNFFKLSTYKMVVTSILDTQEVFKLANMMINLTRDKRNKELENQINNIEIIQKKFSNNIIEEKFDLEERRFSKILLKIKNYDKPNLNLNDYDTLIHFFASQLSRTPKKLNKINGIGGYFSVEDRFGRFDFTKDEYHTFNLYFTLCFTESIYLSCLTRLDQIKIYHNHSDVNFITSDDPSFNQKMDEKKLFIQIPISPRVMIELSESSQDSAYIKSMQDYYSFHKENADLISVNSTLINFYEITREEVITLNNKIFNNCDQFIYAHSLADIKHIKLDEAN